MGKKKEGKISMKKKKIQTLFDRHCRRPIFNKCLQNCNLQDLQSSNLVHSFKPAFAVSIREQLYENSMAKKRKTRKPIKSTPIANVTPQKTNYKCYEGDLLDDLLAKLKRGIESARVTEGKQLPEKIWIKQQFAIGINDVTRVLERMPANEKTDHLIEDSTKSSHRKAPLVPLQAVLVASDCNPRSLTKHIPILASSRNVPLIFVKDNKGSSLRLGELVKLRTAMAIGVKARGSNINSR